MKNLLILAINIQVIQHWTLAILKINMVVFHILFIAILNQLSL